MWDATRPGRRAAMLDVGQCRFTTRGQLMPSTDLEEPCGRRYIAIAA